MEKIFGPGIGEDKRKGREKEHPGKQPEREEITEQHGLGSQGLRRPHLGFRLYG